MKDACMLTTYIPPEVTRLTDIDIFEGVEYNDNSVIVQGVVSPESQGGTYRSNATYKVHAFTLNAWGQVGEQIQSTPLTVLRPIPEGYNFFGELPANSVQRLKVKISTDNERAVLEEILELMDQLTS